MVRSTFLQTTAAGFLTGGLDIWSTPSGVIRVLVSNDRGNETPQLLDANFFGFGGKRWRGKPSMTVLPSGREGVIATLDLDAYLYGVVPLEASPSWPATALQAQAIVARTYAQQKKSVSRPYDVVISESDQRYGGVTAEAGPTNAAVDATRGQILKFNGGPASIFYASCCGGHTADAAEIWGHNTLPYLRGVPDPHCTAAPDYRWQQRVPLDRVTVALGTRAPGSVTGFILGATDASGRPRSIDVLGAAGRSTITPVEFRSLVGATIVRSTWIRTLALDSTQAPAQVVIEGSGRGHGVGFCQWGARFMSMDGTPARDILAFYFPGTLVTGG
jgi:stage II sporulation protein D